MKQFNSLTQFYPFYLTEHSNITCRRLHFIGTTLVIILFMAAFTSKMFWLLDLMPVAGYGSAWIGHFFFEKNKPAAFQHPLWSLASDFKMFWDTLTLQLDAKLEQAQKQYPQYFRLSLLPSLYTPSENKISNRCTILRITCS